MQYKTIKGTELKVSCICLGTADMGGALTKETSFKLLDCFFENGGNLLDTAHVYSNWLPGEKSISEKTIGKWMKERGNRNKIIVSTKGGHPELNTMHISRLSDVDILRDLDESLEYLQTDYIDLYWLHRDDPTRPAGEILEFLNNEVKRGKIRYFGCSNWKSERIREANNYAREHGLISFSASQIMWSLARPNKEAISDPTIVIMDDEEKNFYYEIEMPVLAFSSQAGGFFKKLAQGDLATLNDGMKTSYYNNENMRTFEKIKEIANLMEISITSVVLGYLISQPITVLPIIGSRTIEQLEDSLGASELCFPEKILRYFEKA